MKEKNRWKEVWNRRFGSASGLNLSQLIQLDGFDTGAGRIKESDWRVYASVIAKKIGLFDGAAIFEVGCGAGALLWAFREEYLLNIGGIDYASGLIDVARKVIPEGKFLVDEAIALDVDERYDYVIANGVFHYFDINYAAEVLRRMIKKAKRAVVVTEVPDLNMKKASEALRRSMLSQEEYKIKYTGLEHTYYLRNWFRLQAKLFNLKCELFDGCVPNYAQNKFRFGCVIKKIT